MKHPTNAQTLRLEQRLIQQAQAALRRLKPTRSTGSTPSVIIDGEAYLCFNHFDYLGLSQHPKVLHAFKQAAERYGVGSNASALAGGYTEAHRELEESFCTLTGFERALFFSSGYNANLSLISALTDQHSIVFEDKKNHASLIDAARISQATLKRYPHQNIDKLTQQLNTQPADYLISDAVFSTDGRVAPLTELVDLKHQHNCQLIIDDAHGFGVLGEEGLGTLQHFQLTAQAVDLCVIPCGKAIGGMGAVVLGNPLLIESIEQFGRGYMYSTALPPAMAKAAQASLAVMQSEPEHHAKLCQNITDFKQGCAQVGINLLPSITAIQSVLIGDEATAVAKQAQLNTAGMLVSVFRHPTVNKGQALLRITLTAKHSTTHIHQLIEALRSII